jgi:REP element-mobilizing transposase RayT
MAAKARRVHIQQQLFKHGGKRRGAGRKPKSYRAGSPHAERPSVKASNALQVVLRVVPAVGSMRRRKMYKAVRDASVVAAIRERIRIIHISIQRTHIHLLVEAEDKLALARGMQGFQISMARNINTALGPDKHRRRRGPVFADRYHLVVITSPRQARNAVSYLLNNWRKHGEDRGADSRAWMVDPFSSGFSFPDWRELEHEALMWKIPENRKTYEPLIVYRPRSWLLEKGWKLAGPISVWDAPSQRP